MNLRAAVEHLLQIKKPGMLAQLLLLPLALCSHAYAVAMHIRARLYQKQVLRSYRSPCKIITVGNITVGGTGKTPTVCYLADHLHKEGHRVAVVNRGYRGRATGTPQLVSDGEWVLSSAEAVGDEARMLAEKLNGVGVVAGRDRVAACSMAFKNAGAEIVILDDGFQHLRLKRDLDIVLVNARDPFGNGYLLPRGTLREPPRALRRAGIVLITKADTITGEALTALQEIIKEHHPDAALFSARLKPTTCCNAVTGEEIHTDILQKNRVVAFCSIGDPEHFFSMVKGLGIIPEQQVSFPDHHAFIAADYRRLNTCAEEGAYLLTTEKDVAKIDKNMINKDKLITLEVEQTIEREAVFFQTLKTLAGI